MRRLLQEGEIGTLQSLVIARGAPFQPPPNRHVDEAVNRGDALFEASVDSIDLAWFLTGPEPVAVSALSALPAQGETDQQSYAVGLSGGAVLQSYESFTTAEFESIVMLAGDRGMLIAHGTLSGKGAGTLVWRLNGRNELIPVRERDRMSRPSKPSWPCRRNPRRGCRSARTTSSRCAPQKPSGRPGAGGRFPSPPPTSRRSPHRMACSLSWTPLNTMDAQLQVLGRCKRDNVRIVIDF
ncbi:hypothetical protein AB3G45_28875 [Shinella sp. S4-D37]|uniref:Gfo/Idh/MocA family protein n=1 Tax=Shinella sp. S4-D37 TaxID=3161999 RepID=UPI003466C1FF